MTTPARAPAEALNRRRITHLGLALLLALVAVIAWLPHWTDRLQAAWFDAYQLALPRQPASMPVTVVDIDERSLVRYGQWPWPRTLLAQLVREIDRHGPLAIGIDILMPEPDRLSPEQLLRGQRRADPELARRLDALPSNDSAFVAAIAGRPVVLGWAGMPDATRAQPMAPPLRVVDLARGDRGGVVVAANLVTFGGAIVNVAELDRAAAGHGVLSVGSNDKVTRRVPLAVRVGDRLAPSLAAEMLRVALAAPDLRLLAEGPDVAGIGIAALIVPTERDGQVRVHYAKSSGHRNFSALDVLEGRGDGTRFERKLVLVGVTALALGDHVFTPLGDRAPGSEVHAQLLENIYDQAWLTRPGWAPALEIAVFALLGLVLVYATPRWKPGRAALLAVACVALPMAAGLAAFATRRLVFDAAVPAVGLAVLFGVLILITLAEATRLRRTLERAIQKQREQAAYIAGELQAATRIQRGFLPRPEAVADDPRVEVAASMTPAREVGGDLYDYFRRDDDRLFFLVGDVAGKGLSASLFMAVGKALYKSITLRSTSASVSEIMRAANVEISRDNPEMFFITAVAGILDLRTGVLDYCNAGHENPVVLTPGGECSRLAVSGGPPLCALDDFDYRSGRRELQPGEVICIVTDGVADAQDPTGERYGMSRLLALLAGMALPGITPASVVAAVRADVATFAAGTEPADDLTVLALRWRGA